MHVCIWRYELAMNTLYFVLKYSCITFHSPIHPYMYTNDACNFILLNSSLARTSC